MPLIIGLTGGIGSGKSEVSKAALYLQPTWVDKRMLITFNNVDAAYWLVSY